MTDAEISALISNCKAASGDPTKVDWVDLANVLTQITAQVSLTDLGTPVTGKVAKVVGGVWAQADDETAAAASGWDSNATLTANRTVTMGNFGFTFNKAGNTSVPTIRIDNSYLGATARPLVFKSPADQSYSTDFEFFHQSIANGDSTYNEVMKWGFNPDRSSVPSQPGCWFAIEPHYISGGALLHEYHMSVDPGDGEVRLFSNTYLNRGTNELSTSVFDFRASIFAFSTLTNEPLASFAAAQDPSTRQYSGFYFSMLSANGTGSYSLQNNGVNDILYFVSLGSGARLDFGNNWADIYLNNSGFVVNLPTHANEAAAAAAGLPSGKQYKTSTGEVRIKL